MIVKNLRQKLAETEPLAERHDLQVTDADSGSAVTLSLIKRDGLSCLAWELSVRRLAPAYLDMRQWAERIADRVTSLLEPLRVLEVDTVRNQTLLRGPVAGGSEEAQTYFEVILDGTTAAVVRRYQTAAEAASPRREQVAFALTNEGLLKLVNDIIVV